MTRDNQHFAMYFSIYGILSINASALQHIWLVLVAELASHDTFLKSRTKTPVLQARVTAISSRPSEVSKDFQGKDV